MYAFSAFLLNAYFTSFFLSLYQSNSSKKLPLLIQVGFIKCGIIAIINWGSVLSLVGVGDVLKTVPGIGSRFTLVVTCSGSAQGVFELLAYSVWHVDTHILSLHFCKSGKILHWI